MARLFPFFAPRLMLDYAPVSKPFLTKRELGLVSYNSASLRRALLLLGYTRKRRLNAEDRVYARRATEREVALGRIALDPAEDLGSVLRRYWKLDEAPDVGGALYVFSPSEDGEFWYSVGELRLKVGDDLQETRERVREFLRAIPRLPRAR